MTLVSPPDWLKHPVKGIILDIYGVILNSSDNGASLIEGSLQAVEKLKYTSIPIRFCTNESQVPLHKVVELLLSLKLPVQPDEVFSPVPVVLKYIEVNQLRPYLVVHDNVRDSFKHIDQTNPNCVVMADAHTSFSYEALNKAFNILLEHPKLITMGYGKYYKSKDRLNLDVGAYSKLLEYACGNVKPTIIGKPSSEYFLTAVNDMNIKPEECLMIGDDIMGDINGAQNSGLRGIQVRTGKYRTCTDEPHATVTPDSYVDNLLQAVDTILKYHS